MTARVAIVPHTHWDREWYAPFQSFRFRLVGVLDELLPLLERDAGFARFHLDGQTVVLDDYLEIRPEHEERLRRLASSGRVLVGPWMILMDEFAVSGETIVRNLQMGIARSASFGGAMPVGYLPDMFGHIAQMPQILQQAGIEHAVVWRGVPAAVDRTAFWWQAPDGSRVRAEYLYGSYSNGRDIPDDAKRLVGRARDYEIELGELRLGDMLLMNGTDHQRPQPWLGRVVAEANAVQDDYEFQVTSLPEHLARQPVDGLPEWAGELRSGARANLLMGVLSNRVDVHQACAAAERALERRAEPLAALLRPDDDSSAAFLDEAWRLLVLNSAHDSACACSVDEVVDEVLVRYAQARQLAESVAREAVRRLAAEIDAEPGSTVVFNGSARHRAGLVEVTAPGTGPLHFLAPDGTPRAAQVVAETAGVGWSALVTGQKVRWVLDMMRGHEFAGRRIARWSVVPNPAGRFDVTLEEAGVDDAPVDLADLREELAALGSRGATMRVRLDVAPVRRVLVDTGPVAGFGWTTLRAVDGPGSPGPVSAAGRVLRNEHLTVTVDRTDGTFSIETADGLTAHHLGRLVDGGDGGDTYNYSPPAIDRLVERPRRVRVRTVEVGPVRARLEVDREYRWPTHAIGDHRACERRADETALVPVTTTLELRAGEPFVRVGIAFDNRVRDHRLRAHFPLPARVTTSDAECAFAVVRRGLDAEGGPHEHGLPTFPSRRFVDASDGSVGLALLHDGLLEYEVIGGGTQVALTLLRATGYLSRSEPDLRPNPAGPQTPVESAQMQGRFACTFAVLLHRGDWRTADLYGAADGFLLPLERVRGGVPGARQVRRGQALRVEGAEVSAVRREAGNLVVRVVRAAPDPGPVTVDRFGAPAAGWRVDLRGRPVEPFAGSVVLGPWEIATLRLA